MFPALEYEVAFKASVISKPDKEIKQNHNSVLGEKRKRVFYVWSYSLLCLGQKTVAPPNVDYILEDSKGKCFAKTVTRTTSDFPAPSPRARTRTTNFIHHCNMVIQKSWRLQRKATGENSVTKSFEKTCSASSLGLKWPPQSASMPNFPN